MNGLPYFTSCNMSAASILFHYEKVYVWPIIIKKKSKKKLV